ncbi:diacylglycerol/polyprenol kinase family protein [Chamaesiphon minutus]|uniref:Dolichol kinase n=1 Tax=Chamaesiphon minutus (strain ATCC 27169 / PCC 6605) TaxID=1173020 RepID=K9UEZ3_CHAP6|nr:diacylglycerol/polyprenol kinase family protein [Chamaesiphon minutus]AFY93692.1 dolichol kinase [Chamaesiphon minutus PCC 6605]
MPTLFADSNLWWRIATVPVYVGSIVLTAELLHRYTDTAPEQVRKVVHIGTGNVIILAWLLDLPAWVGITSGILAAIITLISYRLPILPGVNSVGRKSLGTFFYAVSIGIVTAVFWTLDLPYFGVIGILIMAWGDGLAAIIGQRFGKHPYTILGNTKSWEGTLTMLIVSYAIVSLVLLTVHGNTWQTWVVGIPVAIVATGVESIAQWGLDNLTVPLSSAGLAFLVDRFLAGSSHL